MKIKKRGPDPVQPDAVEREYIRGILSMIKAHDDLLRNELISSVPMFLKAHEKVRLDSIGSSIRRVLAGIEVRLSKLFPKKEAERIAKKMTEGANKHAKREFLKVLNRKTKNKLEEMPSKDPKDFLTEAVKENVALISSIPEERHKRLEGLIKNYVQGDRTADDLADAIRGFINDDSEKAKKRAKRIAVDQVNKINESIQRKQMRSFGVDKYIWRTMKDLRVRGRPDGLYPDAVPSHWKREGKVYSFDKPPAGGNPKTEPGCRCYAEPYIQGIDD